MVPPDTLEDSIMASRDERDPGGSPVPGLVLVFTQGRAVCSAFEFRHGSIMIGRDDTPEALISDPRMSRQHVQVSDTGAGFSVRDLGSRNGTFVDGALVSKEIAGNHLRIMRTGSSLFVFTRDVRPFMARGIETVGGTIMGPTLHRAWSALGRLARADSHVFLHGESGTGKERAARAFHSLGRRGCKPFVAVNCSAIPHTMAERLFFGTKRGAYSGATKDEPGYAKAADGGVLFLDEVAELDLATQAKLLRVLESNEVLPLGAMQPQRVDFQICSGTHKNLRDEVSAGRFRQDLYFRIGRPEVQLPPLRERLEEIPWLIADAVAQATGGRHQANGDNGGNGGNGGNSDNADGEKSAHTSLSIHSSFVEACLRRPWPGNVRELITEVKEAAYAAVDDGSERLRDSDLPEPAGSEFKSADTRTASSPKPETIANALREHRGNISGAAKSLGVHRTQFRRLMTRYSLEARHFASPTPHP